MQGEIKKKVSTFQLKKSALSEAMVDLNIHRWYMLLKPLFVWNYVSLLRQTIVSFPSLPQLLKLMLSSLGPVVQSVISLTSSLRVISLTVLADSIYNFLKFFAEKM